MALKGSHNINDFAISFGGALMSGFGNDIAANVEFPNQRWTTEQGCDGESTRMRNNGDLFATVTITLKSSSDSNNKMLLQSEIDRLTGGGVFPLTIIHNKGGEKYTAAGASITKQPAAQIGATETEREWSISCPM